MRYPGQSRQAGRDTAQTHDALRRHRHVGRGVAIPQLLAARDGDRAHRRSRGNRRASPAGLDDPPHGRRGGAGFLSAGRLLAGPPPGTGRHGTHGVRLVVPHRPGRGRRAPHRSHHRSRIRSQNASIRAKIRSRRFGHGNARQGRSEPPCSRCQLRQARRRPAFRRAALHVRHGFQQRCCPASPCARRTPRAGARTASWRSSMRRQPMYGPAASRHHGTIRHRRTWCLELLRGLRRQLPRPSSSRFITTPDRALPQWPAACRDEKAARAFRGLPCLLPSSRDNAGRRQ